MLENLTDTLSPNHTVTKELNHPALTLIGICVVESDSAHDLVRLDTISAVLFLRQTVFPPPSAVGRKRSLAGFPETTL